MKKYIIGYVIGAIMFGSVGVYATYKYNASDIGYKETDVESAVNDLYEKITKKDAELTLGQTYKMGGYDWVAAEEIDGGYVMQSTGMTNGTWPGYKLTSNYEGTKSYGSANSSYRSNIDGDNIANYDNKTSLFYDNWKSVEKRTIYGKGLWLANRGQLGGESLSCPIAGSGYYLEGLKIAAASDTVNLAWTGTLSDFSDGYVFQVRGDGCNICIVHTGKYQSDSLAIAPAFNLDTSKVYLDGTTIKKK